MVTFAHGAKTTWVPKWPQDENNVVGNILLTFFFTATSALTATVSPEVVAGNRRADRSIIADDVPGMNPLLSLSVHDDKRGF